MRSLSLREKIHQLPDSSSRDLCQRETIASHLLLGQIQLVEEDSILDLLVQETSVCQRATNESFVPVCCGRSSCAILLVDC